MDLIWQSAEVTHTGKRRAHNEDAVMSRPDAQLWAVADGMGGHHAGEVASQAIVSALYALVPAGSLAERVDAVEDVLVGVNEDLRRHAERCGSATTIGSTVVTMLCAGATGVALWAGDSRLYRLRLGQLELITRDHNPVSDLLDSGAVSEAEALAADTNIITRAVGGQPHLHLDVAVFDVRPDDTFLLCSDGLYRELEKRELLEGLSNLELQSAADVLLRRCLEGPARDNVSLVIARAAAQPDRRRQRRKVGS
jgi:serine/threonine protein phosphatase PrpC